MTAPRKGRSLEKENVAVDVVSPHCGGDSREQGGGLRPEITLTALGSRPGPPRLRVLATGTFLSPRHRRRTRVLSGGLLGRLGPRGPAGEEAGRPPSREAGQAWAGPPAPGKTVLGSRLGEQLAAAAGGAGAEGPLISLELEIAPLPTASPR